MIYLVIFLLALNIACIVAVLCNLDRVADELKCLELTVYHHMKKQ